jgi:hypothetical protein
LQISNYFRQIGPKAREEGELGWMVPGRLAELKGLGSIPTYGVVWVQWCIPLKIHHWIHMMS